jgi:serine protease Do
MQRSNRIAALCIVGALAGGSIAGCASQPGIAGRGAQERGGVEVHGTSSGARALLAASSDTEQDFRKIINIAKAKVFPAVVFIRCVQQNLSGGERATQQVAGSGVIISDQGEVLTNWHVVDKAMEVRCLLYNGESYEAKVVGTDKDVDLALLKLAKPLGDGAEAPATRPATKPFPFASLGDSARLQEGDFVMAMGAPWGLSRSVSLGIISCTNRFLPSTSEYSIWLQTDAAISPGNSGGPLVNTNGEVIGINTRGISEGGDIGFAVPSATIRPVVDQLRQHGKVDWSWSGLQLQPLKDFERNIYFDGEQGVMVADTDPDSPARHAGIQARDRIMKVNGKPVAALTDEDLPALRRLFGMLPKATPSTLEIVRGSKAMTMNLTPREKGQVEGDELALERWDCTVKTINQFDNPDLYFQKKQGVFIFGTKYPGNAATAGLQRQDVLLKVDDQAVTTLDDLRAVHAKTIKSMADRPRIVLTVLRNGLMRQVVLDISRDYSKE